MCRSKRHVVTWYMDKKPALNELESWLVFVDDENQSPSLKSAYQRGGSYLQLVFKIEKNPLPFCGHSVRLPITDTATEKIGNITHNVNADFV